MAVRNSVKGQSLIEPMYYDYPHTELAYQYRNTFRFGSQLFAAPVTTPRIKSTTFSETPMWLPAGRYVDLFTGTVYDGDRVVTFHRPLDKVPVLAREGGIIPLDATPEIENGCPLPAEMEILLVVGADGHFELVEDDGSGASVQQIEFSKTPITYSQAESRLTIGVSSKKLLAERKWSVRFLSYEPQQEKVKVTCNGQEAKFDWDNTKSPSDPNGWLLKLSELPVDGEIIVDLGEKDPQLGLNHIKDRSYAVIDCAQIENEIKRELWAIMQGLGGAPPSVIISRLEAVGCDNKVRDALLEVVHADSRC